MNKLNVQKHSDDLGINMSKFYMNSLKVSKKFITIVCLITVSFFVCVSLTACGSKSFEGTWVIKTVDLEKLENSILKYKSQSGDASSNQRNYNRKSSDDFFGASLNFENGLFSNKVSFTIFDSTQEGTWTSYNDTEGEVTIGSNTVNMKVEDDNLILNRDNTEIVFIKQPNG